MTIHQLIYTSHPTAAVTTEMLLDLLQKSQENNAQREISGLLVYHNGRFMQLLEGQRDDVLALFEVIRQDARHAHVQILLEKRAAERSMHSWVMGFYTTATLDARIGRQHFYLSLDHAGALSKLIKGDAGAGFQQFLAA
jgi:hypothetical protein